MSVLIRYLFWNRCRPDGGPAEVVAHRLALRDDRHSLRGHLPPQFGSKERGGERERAHFTTRWRRRKSPHLELLLLPRLLQICPRPLRGGHVRQGGTGRRGGGGATKTKREDGRRSERPLASDDVQRSPPSFALRRPSERAGERESVLAVAAALLLRERERGRLGGHRRWRSRERERRAMTTRRDRVGRRE